MFHVDKYMNDCISLLKESFGRRLLYVGLQGSYLRGEATEKSDLDVMAVIDGLSVSDLDRYRNIFMELPDYEKSCGFLCGREEMENWNPLEICHLLHTTKDFYGKLSPLVPDYTKEDVRNDIRLSVGNLYHEICHRYIHQDGEKNRQGLIETYRNVFFILQNVYYLKTGHFYITKKELLCHLDEADKKVMEMSVSLKEKEQYGYDFNQAFEMLFTWCQRLLKEL